MSAFEVRGHPTLLEAFLESLEAEFCCSETQKRTSGERFECPCGKAWALTTRENGERVWEEEL